MLLTDSTFSPCITSGSRRLIDCAQVSIVAFHACSFCFHLASESSCRGWMQRAVDQLAFGVAQEAGTLLL